MCMYGVSDQIYLCSTKISSDAGKERGWKIITCESGEDGRAAACCVFVDIHAIREIFHKIIPQHVKINME